MPAPKTAAIPIGARIQAEWDQGSDVTEIICLVTVTCDGNGAAALPPSQDLPPSRAQAGTRRRRRRHTGCIYRPWIAQPARSPARVGLRPGTPATPAGSRRAVPE